MKREGRRCACGNKDRGETQRLRRRPRRAGGAGENRRPPCRDDFTGGYALVPDGAYRG
nr:MAG TPA: hypothetical protein [Bacteriophage sp.]